MDGSIDLALPGGWHVTLFDPWMWVILAAVVLLLLVAAAFKFAVTW